MELTAVARIPWIWAALSFTPFSLSQALIEQHYEGF